MVFGGIDYYFSFDIMAHIKTTTEKQNITNKQITSKRAKKILKEMAKKYNLKTDIKNNSKPPAKYHEVTTTDNREKQITADIIEMHATSVWDN